MIGIGSHDAILVGLSILVAVAASYTALHLATRATEYRGTPRKIWLSCASTALGGGIWSMHFVAMLAFRMPGMAVSYDLGLTLASLTLAIVFTGIGFAVMYRWAGKPRLISAGLLMGFGIVAMHYVGMAAMKMDAAVRYDPLWVALSILIAIGAAISALSLASGEQNVEGRVGAALLMGVAISGMHYSGMRAATFNAHSHAMLSSGTPSISQPILAWAIAVLTLSILLLALGAASLDRMLSAMARREARSALRVRLADAIRDTSPEQALHETVALIGEHFHVARVGYAQPVNEDDLFDYQICWTDGTVPSLLGLHRTEGFGAQIVALLKTGQTVAIDDLIEAAGGATDLQTRAILVVPFFQNGQLRNILYLSNEKPRHWTTDEILFMKEIAERTRQIIARNDAETRLRELNETLEHRVVEAMSAREVLAAVVDNTTASIMVCDHHLNILALNTAQSVDFQRIYGRPCDVGDNLLELLSALPDHRDMIHAQWLRALRGETFIIVDEFGHTAYEQIHFEVHFHPMRDAAGAITGAFLTAYDVSTRVRAQRDLQATQEALRQSQKMEAMGQLTGGVAHDFNNLLTPILGALDMLQRRGVGSEREQRLIVGAFQSADKARVLVQRLLAFARRQPLQAVAVDIGKLVVEMADLVGSTTGPQIRVSVDAPADLPSAKADPNQLEMALLNLSVNARDAMPDGGVLRISARAEDILHDRGELKPGGYICLSVADTGTGMDEVTAARAIEPFFSTKGIGKGTGLGLSMVHGLASQLGGALKIDSRVGIGTNVELWLPRTTEAEIESHVTQPSARKLARGTALLVDDEELVRMSTAEMLHDLGYAVVEASSAEEAIRLLQGGEAVDVLLTDHLMPGMTGAALAHAVRDTRPGLPVLLVSGYAELEGVAADLPRLTKPFRKDELAACLAEL
jgi:PAS domain S-box-containing protein